MVGWKCPECIKLNEDVPVSQNVIGTLTGWNNNCLSNTKSTSAYFVNKVNFTLNQFDKLPKKWIKKRKLLNNNEY